MAKNFTMIKKEYFAELNAIDLKKGVDYDQLYSEFNSAITEKQLQNIISKAEKLKSKQISSEVDYDEIIDSISEEQEKVNVKGKIFSMFSSVPIIRKFIPKEEQDEEYIFDKELEESMYKFVTEFTQYFTKNSDSKLGPWSLNNDEIEDVISLMKAYLKKEPERILMAFTIPMRKRVACSYNTIPHDMNLINISNDLMSFEGTGKIYNWDKQYLNESLDKIGLALEKIYVNNGKFDESDELKHTIIPSANQTQGYVLLYNAAKEIVDKFYKLNEVADFKEQGNINFLKVKSIAKKHFKWAMPIIYVAIYLFKPYAFNLQSITFLFWLTLLLFLIMFLYKDSEQSKKVKLALTLPFIVSLIYLGGNFIWGQAFIDNGSAAYNQIGKVVDLNKNDFKKFEFSPKQTYVVNSTMAKNLADKVIGEGGTSSKYQIGSEALQNIKVNGEDHLYWVFGLIYGNIFSQFQNGKVDKVIIVDANDPSKSAQLLSTNKAGKNFNITLLQGGFLQQNISRMIQIENPTKLITDFSFELDDDLNPHYIVTVYSYIRGFALTKVEGIIDVDLQHNNKQTYYDINRVPTWVDRVIPLTIAQEQITNHGEYVHGVFNFSNLDKFMMSLNATATQTSAGSTEVTNNATSVATSTSTASSTASTMVNPVNENVNYIFFKNHPYFITGLTSKAGDAALQGFMLRSLHDNTTYRIKTTGAIEAAAKQSAKGVTQNFNYDPANPILVFAENKLQYLIPLRDTGGLIKKYALVEVEHYQNVKIFDSLDAFIKGEKSDINFQVASDGSNPSNNSNSEDKNVTKQQIIDKLHELENMLKGLKE